MLVNPPFHVHLVWEDLSMLISQHRITDQELDEGVALAKLTRDDPSVMVARPTFTSSMARAGTPVQKESANVSTTCNVEEGDGGLVHG
jgi:hypothetical protein